MTALRSATIAAVVGTVLALMAPAKTLFAQGGGNPNPGVLPPNSSPFGRTYPEWSAAWLQWAFSQPVSTNPNFDPTGALANNAQSGPVFFLASVINLSGTVERTFSVPAGRAIFFPITTIEGDNACVEPPLTMDQLRAGAAALLATVEELHASVDGVPLRDLPRYRVISPVFSYTLPATDNLAQFFGCDISGAVSPAVSDGFFILLAPLSRGRHDVRFGATFGPGNNNFQFEVVDHMTIGP